MMDTELFSIEAEQAILGDILLKPNIVSRVSGLVRPEDFYRPAHKDTFAVMQQMALEGASIDIVNLAERLRKVGKLDTVGGIPFITFLGRLEATAAGVDEYCATVRAYSKRRRIAEIARQVLAGASDMKKDLATLENELQDALMEEAEQFSENKSVYDAAALVFALQADIDKRAEGEMIGVKTGLHSIDSRIGAMEPGNLVIIAGRPSHGKSALACTIAVNAAKAGKRILWFTLEMDAVETARRIVSNLSGVDNQKFKSPNLQAMTEGERSLYIQGYEAMAKLGLYVCDVTNQTPLDIWRTAQRIKASGGLDLVIIDYIGLMSAGSLKKENRTQEVSYITRTLKNMAGALRIPVLALSQLNRANDKEGRMPRLSDLRDSGSLEQDANIVMLIHRDSYLAEDGTLAYENTATLDIAKVRDGRTGSVKLDFTPACSAFDDHEE